MLGFPGEADGVGMLRIRLLWFGLQSASYWQHHDSFVYILQLPEPRHLGLLKLVNENIGHLSTIWDIFILKKIHCFSEMQI